MELAIATASVWNITAIRFQNFRGSDITARGKLPKLKLPIAAIFSYNFRHQRLLCSATKSPIVLPQPIREFPWKKAGNVFAHHLLNIGKDALKCWLAVLYMTSFYEDVLLSFSQKREMLIPVGMLVGVLLADFIKKTTEELLLNTQKEWSMDNRHVVVICAAFVAIKFVILYLLPRSAFPRHVCNGSLMQICWSMKNFKNGTGKGSADISE